MDSGLLAVLLVGRWCSCCGRGLGLSVDIVVSPFIKDFLGQAQVFQVLQETAERSSLSVGEVLQRSAERLVNPCEDQEAFGCFLRLCGSCQAICARMSIRAAQVAGELKSTNCAVDSDEAPSQVIVISVPSIMSRCEDGGSTKISDPKRSQNRC